MSSQVRAGAVAGWDADDSLRTVAGWIDEANAVTVLTGAGISTDSGIPDFRGPNGVWTKNPAAEKQATLQNYLADPEVRVAAWRSRLDHRVRGAVPNAGHRALVQLERRRKLVSLLTQNVDGLHHDAGSDPDKIVEVHGTMREAACLECDYRTEMGVVLDRVRLGEADPPCPECGGILKSATISFGQQLVARDLLRAQAAAENCELMLAVGTTLAVYPIAAVVPTARSAGARVVIVNAEPTEMDHLADQVLRGSISDILPYICGRGHAGPAKPG
ncbi:SIR2 family NAD-dependent protein deacylase [Candidatus Poriferisodalis sp.]|uniref:SIR2 family NAD-dependent protein deacylase n=1 Tax=Candidatus Poriferisodalis sp. TaxID=3101277 RepID=UPI003B01E428